MAANAFRIGNGNTVNVVATATINEGDLAYVGGWLGVVPRETDSGEQVALNIEYAEFDMLLPVGLNLSQGDEVFVDITDLTGNTPDDSAYYTATDTDRIKLGRCTTDQDGTTGQVRIQSALRGQ